MKKIVSILLLLLGLCGAQAQTNERLEAVGKFRIVPSLMLTYNPYSLKDLNNKYNFQYGLGIETEYRFHEVIGVSLGVNYMVQGVKTSEYQTGAAYFVSDKNKEGEVSSCDILFTEDIEVFSQQYMEYTLKVAESRTDRDLSDECMVIGTSAIIDTEIDGAVGMNSGIYNNPFMIWGRYRKRWFRYELPISFQFHHTQMDGAHAGKFLSNLQEEINRLYN